MKIKRGKSQVKLPDYGEILGVSVKALVGGEERWTLVQRVTMHSLREERAKQPELLGMPVICCVQGNFLQFFPAADQTMDLRIRYFPPEMEA